MVIIVICLLMGKKCKFKVDNKNFQFPTQFCIGSISNKFGAIDSREVSLEGNLYNFSVD